MKISTHRHLAESGMAQKERNACRERRSATTQSKGKQENPCRVGKNSASQPGCTCTPWGEFEILRGEILKKGELGVNYTQRGEAIMLQIVLCQLYNTGFLSFQIVINRDLRLKLTKLVQV